MSNVRLSGMRAVLFRATEFLRKVSGNDQPQPRPVQDHFAPDARPHLGPKTVPSSPVTPSAPKPKVEGAQALETFRSLWRDAGSDADASLLLVRDARVESDAMGEYLHVFTDRPDPDRPNYGDVPPLSELMKGLTRPNGPLEGVRYKISDAPKIDYAAQREALLAAVEAAGSDSDACLLLVRQVGVRKDDRGEYLDVVADRPGPGPNYGDVPELRDFFAAMTEPGRPFAGVRIELTER